MTYTMGSLFAGIGGFDLGFERAGFKTLWQVEIDPYAQKVLAKNFPEAERFGDIRECGSHNLKPVDVICGGFPCQDISNAGKRAGIEGERSGLWSEMHRIIRELRPRYVLVENVAALLGRGMGRVLGDLAEIGYDAEWDCIRAGSIGFEHLRERLFLVAHPNNQKQPVLPLNGKEREGLQVSDRRIQRRLQEPRMGRVAHGVPARVDRLRGLGNAVVPQIPEMFAHRIREALEAA
jgi:DNA (cytosine-5)-methyltransferase 1